MNKLILVFFLAGFFSLLTFNIVAKEINSEPLHEVRSSPPAQPTIIFKKAERHQFSGSQLKGQLKKPELSYIYKRRGLKQDKIVNIPENFNEKIINGAKQF